MSRRPPARRPLTPRQRDVLAAIRAHLDEAGTAPSVREIGAAVGLASTRSVHRYILELEAAGYIRRPRGYGNGTVGGSTSAAPRAIEVVGDTPRLGRVIAVLRIPAPSVPAPAACTHPRTGANRWHVAGVVLCRACGRAAVAAHLAAKAVR